MIVQLLCAYVHYRKGNQKQTINFLEKFLELRKRIGVSMWPYPYILEICWAIERKKFPEVAGLNLKNEINLTEKSGNVFMIGIVRRFSALLKDKDGAPKKEVYELLKQSESHLLKSGHLTELLRTRLTLYNFYLGDGQNDMAKKTGESLTNKLSELPVAMIPPDLMSFRTKEPDMEHLSEGISVAGNKIMTVRDQTLLIHQLVTNSNQMMGAERGAVFLFKDGILDFNPFATSNLTKDQIMEPVFEEAKKSIEQVLKSGEGLIKNIDISNRDEKDPIRSLICVPLKLKNRPLGILYHDHRMLLEAFNNNHLKLLNYFAVMICVVIKNHILEKELSSIIQGSLTKKQNKKPQLEEHHGIIGQTPVIKRVLSMVHQVAPTDTTVLILGETGTGKELVAKAIHDSGNRKDGPFISVNCNALPDTLISSELFGHEKGAFTGAGQQRTGRFELAAGGTLFLDEIGELPMETQVKLLRVLQSREFERIGGNKTIKSDFRLLTATNRNLEKEVERKNFRSDLFYRLNIFPITIPSLKERKEDIPQLAQHFLQKYCVKIGKRFLSFPESEMAKLIKHNWPGNVRELENVIERATISSVGSIFQIQELVKKNNPLATPGLRSGMSLSEAERLHIIQALKETHWKIRGTGGAAELLEINASTLYSRMKKLDISKEKDR
ncbi:MAG: AAA domain-containing protein [Desulfobacteraceae bacterium]|nr:AAA domain-containing protein [Desulfobacteraceae bacterium]